MSTQQLTAGQKHEQQMQQMQAQQGLYQREAYDYMYHIQEQMNQMYQNADTATGQNQDSANQGPSIVCVVE